jgi:hypothetical protein
MPAMMTNSQLHGGSSRDMAGLCIRNIVTRVQQGVQDLITSHAEMCAGHLQQDAGALQSTHATCTVC